MLKKIILQTSIALGFAFSGLTALACPADDGLPPPNNPWKNSINSSFVSLYNSLITVCQTQQKPDSWGIDCDYEGHVIQIKDEIQLEAFKRSLQPLSTHEQVKEAIKETLFTHFAYANPSEEDKEAIYPFFWRSIMAAQEKTAQTSGAWFLTPFNFFFMKDSSSGFPELDQNTHLTFEEHSSVGMPPRLVIQSGYSFFVVGSNIND